MKVSRMDATVRDLGTLFRVGAVGGLSDGQLLGRFVERREADAFEAIVHRHAPMVWGVCRRVLRDRHDAEDAFQATFLVLARRAASIIPREKLGNWLYGVAYQTARKARATRVKRRVREGHVSDLPEPVAVPAELRDDLAESLDRELSRLPEKYRIAIVLCDLEGMTHREATSQIGLPIGTVSSRLARARAILAKRLSRPGINLTVGSLGALLGQDTVLANVPSKLFGPTAQAASLIAARRAVMAGMVSAEVAALTREVMKTMLLSKVKVVTGVLLLATTLVSAGVSGSQDTERKSDLGPTQGTVKKNDQERFEGQSVGPRVGEHRITLITVITDTSTIPKGSRCQVTLNAETDGQTKVVEMVYDGKVSEATAEGVMLTLTSVERKESHPSDLSKLPIVNRLFTNKGIARPKLAEEKVWFPAGKIRSITLTKKGTP